jgi:hypothetical protein
MLTRLGPRLAIGLHSTTDAIVRLDSLCTACSEISCSSLDFTLSVFRRSLRRILETEIVLMMDAIVVAHEAAEEPW